MCHEDFKKDFAAVLEIPCEKLTSDFNLVEGAVWDSLAFLSTMALIDKHYQMVVDPAELMNVVRFGQLLDILEVAEV
ncbi:hypothetical protein ACO0KY_06015 [Undibacterium sp. Dicai25W]|uniref:hypothetical protein n=1 Tax=Undibacterium sp. Dicai25W TaxID=3413034 RepID=UPI003BEF9D25